jgi:hypothetical protein
VQVKYIADPSMHAIASVGLSPNKKWWCGQSMDNQSKHARWSAALRCALLCPDRPGAEAAACCTNLPA